MFNRKMKEEIELICERIFWEQLAKAELPPHLQAAKPRRKRRKKVTAVLAALVFLIAMGTAQAKIRPKNIDSTYTGEAWTVYDLTVTNSLSGAAPSMTGTIAIGDGTGEVTFNTQTNASFSDKNITNVGDLGLDSISADGASIAIGSAAGKNISIGNSTGNYTVTTDSYSAVLTDATDNVFQLGDSAGHLHIDIDLGADDTMTFGNNSQKIVIDSSDWNISATGDMTGIGSLASNGAISTTSTLDVDGNINLGDTTAGADVTIGNSTGNITGLSDNCDFTLTDATDNVFQLIQAGGGTLFDIDLGASDLITIGDGTIPVDIAGDVDLTATGGSSGSANFDIAGYTQFDSPGAFGAWGYTGEHVALSATSANTNAGLSEYFEISSEIAAGKVMAGEYSRLVCRTAQPNQVTMVGTESQFRLRNVNIANGVHAGLWAYAEQSGTTTLSGGGTFDAISATVESEAGFTVGATEHVTGATIDSSINASASIDASANFSGIYVKSNGKDWFTGVKITGVDTDIELQNGETISNATDGSIALSGTLTAPALTTVADATDTRVCTSADYGKVIMLTHADTVAVTLPANGAAAGSWIDFMWDGNDSLAVTVSSAVADTLVTPNSVDSDSFTYGTGHRMGAYARVISDGDYWHVQNLCACTMTVTDTD